VNPAKDQFTTAGKTIYFDCYSGISGDMTLGALLDLGGYRLEAEKVNRGGIAGTRAIVHLDEAPPVERHLSTILDLINESALPGPVKIKSSAIFQHLAEAEAAVHGITVEKVHFHEVGAVDAIVDIVGVAAALFLLKVEQIICSPLPAGRGEVQTAHGLLPLPAPATLELLARRKAPVRGCNHTFELVTPTGAAIVTALADSFGPMPSFNLRIYRLRRRQPRPGLPQLPAFTVGSYPVVFAHF
jgi:pyridinium-3,5-bisthiocarboxylic acid mononucleotide nickel chelatase